MSQVVMEQSDSGGVAALKGFTYQNLAAAYYVLNMLRDKSLVSVRCEVVDDIDLIYHDRIEYVQVKTTDGDSKWCVQDFAEATTKVVPPTGLQRNDQIVSNEDSILHKSILCDKGELPGYFRILTLREVTDSLKYLKTSLDVRYEKLERRPALLKRLQNCIKRNRPNKKPPFISPNGNDVEYWLDHAEWEVVSSPELLELRCTKLILQSAQNKGVYLSANGDPERILASLLNSLFKKGASSRVLKSMADKSYHRSDFISWFNEEIEHYATHSNEHIKVYPTASNQLQAVLSSFFNDSNVYDTYNFSGDKIWTGLQGQYHRNKYSYDLIAKNIYGWFHEVLLLPNEIADNSPQNVTTKFTLFTQRYRKQTDFLNELVAKVLLHSTIRTESKTQPIAANLYFDDNQQTCFDNIHILLDDHLPDKLLMGFSRLINEHYSLSDIVQDFDNLLTSDAFSNQKEKILEAKAGSHLLEHDIDDILAACCSLDKNLHRFKFVFFIGYESEHLECNSKNMALDFESHLISEATTQFKALVDQLIAEDDFYEDLHVEVYLYPSPSLNALINAVQTQVSSQWKIA